MLELACGTGRLTYPLADAGTRVVGLDIDPVMLAAAKRRSGQEWPTFVAADMRRFAFAQRFQLVFVGYNSLQLLTTTADMIACLRTAREHVAPGGMVGVEVTDFQCGGADGPDTDISGMVPLGDAEGIRLSGTLDHDLASRVSCYRRHFSGDDWSVDDVVRVRSLDEAELEELFRRAGLRHTRSWADGATLRAVAAP